MMWFVAPVQSSSLVWRFLSPLLSCSKPAVLASPKARSWVSSARRGWCAVVWQSMKHFLVSARTPLLNLARTTCSHELSVSQQGKLSLAAARLALGLCIIGLFGHREQVTPFEAGR